ncbi:Mannose-specific lectin-like [Oopsacas minuta]|uniref:Mannose-specific lectin-like n=1 Tax=Oopsacas minuta TaxID=111878 RepID=A0AAV7K1B8_9METZ|nr:Mannose-specific lectin-like [Oopsacas minuta]
MGSILSLCPGMGVGKEENFTNSIQDSINSDNVVMRGGDVVNQGQCVHCGVRVNNNGISVVKYYYLRLQGNGELVLYTPTFIAGIPMEIIWQTGGIKQGTRPYKLKLEQNANLVIQDIMGMIMWQTNSKQKNCKGIPEVILNGESFGIRVGKKIVWSSALK